MKKDYERNIKELATVIKILIHTTFMEEENDKIGMYWDIGSVLDSYRKEKRLPSGVNIIGKISERLSPKYGELCSTENLYFSVFFYRAQLDGKKTEEFDNLTWEEIKKHITTREKDN